MEKMKMPAFPFSSLPRSIPFFDGGNQERNAEMKFS
jgi:hypothetical protein